MARIEPKDYKPKTGRKRGSTTDKTKAVESHLAMIAAKNGGVISPHEVVKYAEDPTSVLHGFFTWDDSEAAEKYRLVEARQLITSIKIYREDKEVRVRALTSLNVDRRGGGGYRFMDRVMESPTLRQHLLETAFAELESVQRKYDSISELDRVWGTVEEVREATLSDKTHDANQDGQKAT